MNLLVNVTVGDVYTMNVIADTLTGDPESIVVVGSHLDSVPAGPGMNDDGSGEFLLVVHMLA